MKTIETSEFARRRKQFMEKMPPRSIAILSAAPERYRNADTDYLYRQDSDFYYLTGFKEPEAIAVFIPGRSQGQYILFNRVRDPLLETWNGRRAGQEGAVKQYGADEAFPISDFVKKLPELLAGCEKVAYCIGRDPEFDRQLLNMINTLHSKVRMGVVVPREFINVEEWIHEMRLMKSSAESEMMRKAAQITAKAHKRAMQVCRPGMYEYQLQAEFLHEYFYNGSLSPAYNPIIGGGENGCILHYVENDAVLKDGDLVLIDAGCEYEYYSSDVTRTFPVNGRFTPEQKAIYDVVLEAQLACIAKAKPGNTLDEIHNTSLNIIVEGLVKLGILQGKVSDLIEQKAYMPFFMHRTGHWLGLDTHDAGLYKKDGKWRKLEAGMAHTIEPGIYIAANTPGVDKKWWNIGVRIEDDILITSSGCEVLSADAPKTIAEIEALMASAR